MHWCISASGCNCEIRDKHREIIWFAMARTLPQIDSVIWENAAVGDTLQVLLSQLLWASGEAQSSTQGGTSGVCGRGLTPAGSKSKLLIL